MKPPSGDYPPITQRPALCSRSLLRSIAEGAPSWLARILEPLGLKTTRIGLGLPIGSDLEYADDLTLDRALEGRRPV